MDTVDKNKYDHVTLLKQIMETATKPAKTSFIEAVCELPDHERDYIEVALVNRFIEIKNSLSRTDCDVVLSGFDSDITGFCFSTKSHVPTDREFCWCNRIDPVGSKRIFITYDDKDRDDKIGAWFDSIKNLTSVSKRQL